MAALRAARASRWGWPLALTVTVLLSGCRRRNDDSARIVAAELADEASLATMSDWLALPTLADGRYRQQSSEDRDSGRRPAQALWERGNRDMNNFVCASQGADPASGTEPFVVDLPHCPDSHVRGWVLSRFEGSGRLSRLWLTAASIRRRPADREVLRIYVDDEQVPVLQVPLSEAIDGSAGEIFSTPFGAGSRRRLAWHYPVVFASRLVIALDHLDPKDLYFHQTSVVLDRHAQPRRRAEQRLESRRRAMDVLAGRVLPAGDARVQRLSLPPGEARTALELTGPATIVSASVRLAHADLARLDEIDLAVTWDAEPTAAIDVTLAELFAAVDAAPEGSSLALSASRQGGDIVLELRLPMPFSDRSRWTLTNRHPTPIELELSLRTLPQLPESPWGRLAVQRHDTPLPLSMRHRLASVGGRGRLAGVCMSMRGHALNRRGMRGHPMNFLEGDELGLVDGVRAMAGTGTEDYFDGAFYFEEGATAGPFAQVWGIVPDDPKQRGHARSSACRWHVLGDEVDFDASLELDMEIGPGDASVLDRYRSVAYLYRP